jgi:hypothetical protein
MTTLLKLLVLVEQDLAARLVRQLQKVARAVLLAERLREEKQQM